MEDRLLKLLDTEQLSSSRFADVIGVQRSSVSHIISGRNKPSFDFLQKTLKAFPMLNADWLLLGKGSMYQGDATAAGGTLFSSISGETTSPSREDVDTEKEIVDHPHVLTPGELSASVKSEDRAENNVSEEATEQTTGPIPQEHEKKGRLVSKIIVLYTDNSFDAYDPA